LREFVPILRIQTPSDIGH